jgi:hypothetical protein
MKTYLLPVVGLLLGGLVAYWGLGLLFVTPFDKIFPKGMLPLGLAALASFALTWVNPKSWKILAASVALPSGVVIALVLLQLQDEGRGDDGKWMLVASTVFIACAVPSWLARKWQASEQA